MYNDANLRKLFHRESESGLINCCIDGVRESLPFDMNSFETRGGLQYGDMVRNNHVTVELKGSESCWKDLKFLYM